MKSLEIIYKSKHGETYLLDAHIDPNHKDIVLNGFGIKKKQAKQIRNWLTKALRETI